EGRSLRLVRSLLSRLRLRFGESLAELPGETLDLLSGAGGVERITSAALLLLALQLLEKLIGLPLGAADDLERVGTGAVQRLAPVGLELAQIPVILLPQRIHVAGGGGGSGKVQFRRLLVR